MPQNSTNSYFFVVLDSEDKMVSSGVVRNLNETQVTEITEEFEQKKAQGFKLYTGKSQIIKNVKGLREIKAIMDEFYDKQGETTFELKQKVKEGRDTINELRDEIKRLRQELRQKIN